jgi:hypothetical protein
MADGTIQDYADLYGGRGELRLAPADKGDVRFIVTRTEEPDHADEVYWVRMVDDAGRVVDSFGSGDPGGAIEAFRYCQSTTLEERWAEDARCGR